MPTHSEPMIIDVRPGDVPKVAFEVARQGVTRFRIMDDGTMPDVAGSGISPFPLIVNPASLAPWKALAINASLVEAPIFVAGDSHPFGQYFDGSANIVTDVACAPVSWVARLRAAFAALFGDPGEGFWFPNDGRITLGGGITTGINTGPAVLRNSGRFTANTHTHTFTIPAGNTTRLRFINANRSGTGTSNPVAEVGTVTVTKNAVAGASITSLGNDVFTVHEYACVAGDVFVFTGPAAGSGQAVTCLGYELRSALTHGVPVHRMGKMGYTASAIIGGSYNGTIGCPDGTTLLTDAQIAAEVRACYQWAAPPAGFLFIVMDNTNENSRQFLTSGIDCGMTPARTRAVHDIIIKTVTADGGRVLLVSPCPSPSENTAASAAPLSSYAAMMYSLSYGSQAVSMIDIASHPAWGGGFSGVGGNGQPVEVDDVTKAAAIAAAGVVLRDPGSSHPRPAGHQSYADIVFAQVRP